MIKDLVIIRQELEDYVEVDIPYDFQKDMQVKYITLINDEEAFYKGGKFKGLGNDSLILSNGIRCWSVPVCKRNKDGSICYASRFFVPNNDCEEKCDKEKGKLHKIIHYQQTIIEKLTEELKDSELMKNTLLEDKQTYEELLQQNRYTLKQLCIDSREKDEIIQNLKSSLEKVYIMNHKD